MWPTNCTCSTWLLRKIFESPANVLIQAWSSFCITCWGRSFGINLEPLGWFWQIEHLQNRNLSCLDVNNFNSNLVRSSWCSLVTTLRNKAPHFCHSTPSDGNLKEKQKSIYFLPLKKKQKKNITSGLKCFQEFFFFLIKISKSAETIIFS